MTYVSDLGHFPVKRTEKKDDQEDDVGAKHKDDNTTYTGDHQEPLYEDEPAAELCPDVR